MFSFTSPQNIADVFYRWQWWQVDKISPIKLFDENKTVCGFNLRTLLFRQNRHDYIRDIVNKLVKMYSEGKIRPHIDSAWAFEDVGIPIVSPS